MRGSPVGLAGTSNPEATKIYLGNAIILDWDPDIRGPDLTTALVLGFLHRRNESSRIISDTLSALHTTALRRSSHKRFCLNLLKPTNYYDNAGECDFDARDIM
jgi:hypothetical protein